MKMTDRIGPNRSGINHQGRRYSPKELVRKGLPSFSGGYVPLSNAELAEMILEFRAKFGRDPTTYYHSGLGKSGQQQLVPLPDGSRMWIRLKCNGTEDYLE